MTKDCVLIARHNPWLSDNTNIAAIADTAGKIVLSAGGLLQS